MTDRLYTINEAAARMNVSRGLIYKLIRNEAIRTVRVGSRYRISETAIVDHIAEATKIHEDGRSRDRDGKFV